MQTEQYSIETFVGAKLRDIRQVHGGAINEAYCVETEDSRVFLKRNSVSLYPGMLEKEARGLAALNVSGLKVPAVVAQRNSNDKQYLVLEWLNPGRNDIVGWEKFGRGIALLHQQSAENFGWQESNYIGRLVQQNKLTPDWNSFYKEQRILPLVEELIRTGKFAENDRDNANRFCERAGEIFPPEPPALLHGDLWSGNFMFSTDGPAIFDPAVYFGHREMDIGMSLLFGGFESSFYAAYNEVLPLAPGWRSRLHLTQFYPLLVHAILFGGNYTSRCRQLLENGA